MKKTLCYFISCLLFRKTKTFMLFSFDEGEIDKYFKLQIDREIFINFFCNKNQPNKTKQNTVQGNALDKRVSNIMLSKGQKKEVIYLTAADIEENFSCDIDTANQIVRLFTLAKSEHDRKNSPPDTVSARDLAAVLASKRE